VAFSYLGIDILGPFPLAIRQMKYLIVAIQYFTKWIEAEPVAQITAHKVQHFVWKNIVCYFGVPRWLISDNGTVPSRIRALTKSRSKSTPGVKVNTRRRLGEETPSASVAKRKRRQGKASPR